MNIKEAKNIPIEDCLHRIGIFPNRRDTKKDWLWYCSPLRGEKTPSLKVDQRLNLWYDFGSGEGGTVLDLVMKLKNTDIQGALSYLQEVLPVRNHGFSFQQQKDKESKLVITKVGHLQSRALLEYLKSRKISPDKASRLVQQANYQINHKKYFALAFRNDMGGYELRNKYFKGGSSPKAITTIKGFSKALNIFEGFMDFLTGLEYYDIKKPANTTIVLNSVNNLDKIIETIKDFRRINLYLDNDDAGKRATQTIMEQNLDVVNQSQAIYPENKDFNEYLVNTKK